MTSKVFYELLIPPTLRQLFTLESVCIEGGVLAIFIRLFNFFHGFYFIARWGEKGGEGLDSRNVFTFFPRVCAWFVCVIWGGGDFGH